MPMMPVPTGKAVVRDVPDGLEIVVPAKRNIFLVLFLGFWLVGWACGEFFVSKTLLSPKFPTEPRIFLVAWLGAWTCGGAFALCTWLWMVAGRERLILGPTTLTLAREIFRIRRRRDFDLAHVKNLRVSPQSYSPFDPAAGIRLWGLSGGSVAFDCGAKTFRVGASLDEAEAQNIVTTLLSRNRTIGRSDGI